MATQPYLGIHPTLGAGVYIHPTALVVGDVVLGDQVSIWPMAVVRGDVNHVHIGHRSNVQDGSVLHVARPYRGNDTGWPLVIGEDVVIGRSWCTAARSAIACWSASARSCWTGSWSRTT
jgi:carbonic anhydrase/acetyltransferase-like protein (isoleucine patch superfamily)